ncbi:unnamed protein product [Ectocarpus sp. 12 AP-2014]
MKTFLACTFTAATVCGVSGFHARAGMPRPTLQLTPQHSFCSRAPSSSGTSTTSPRPWAQRQSKRRPRADGSRTQRAASSLSMFDATDLFQLQQWAGDISATELTHVSPVTIGVMYGTGLLMSLSPCALSLLPLTISYIAGSEAEVAAEEAAEGKEKGGFDSLKGGFVPSAAFAAGLATVLSLLGLSATYAGKVMGSSAFGTGLGATVLPLAASAFAVAMGLNVLELVQLNFPSFEGGLDYMTSLPKNARAYLLGESPPTPGRPRPPPPPASILGFIATSQDPALGLVLLLTYSAGYTTPLMAAGTASGVLSRLMSAKGLNWITPASGALLISYGTYNGLAAIFGSA